MKKYLLIVLALAVALSIGAPAMAKQGLSVGASFGILPNAAGLGSSIATDGLDKDIDMDATGNTTGYDTLTLIPSEKSMLDDQTSGKLKDVNVNGPMTAMDMGLVVRYDLLGYLFVRQVSTTQLRCLVAIPVMRVYPLLEKIRFLGVIRPG